MPPRAAQRAAPRGADNIRILVATDSHVGYNETDPTRGDDSWRTFDEVMALAKEHDVDMVLHGGDLFHENKPSRKAMYHVMKAFRKNCLGDKPCELEMLSDASENFEGDFNHVNYEDPDINVAIPVFAIHGNHDDPSGQGNYSALDILHMSGLVNYYGRNNDQTKVTIKPVLLQKGRTKLALYGMSNMRDERMFRTFRDGGVKFFQPGTQRDEWFNLMTVHQNHHAYTETGYLPENFLPEFVDLVVWGHEHECLIDPRYNPEMGFHVMQPGSSVATSLMPGEAVPKHVAILNITGKEFTSESIRLRSVRPFIMKEIVLADERAIKEKQLWKMTENRTKITQHLMEIVDELIETAKREWLELQDDRDQDDEVPLPLVRLRVEYTAPENGTFHVENPQRFSNRFTKKVANTNDVVQFYRKKQAANRKTKVNAELPDESILDQFSLDNLKIDELVKEFLEAQSLTILPQNSFGDAVTQFVDKDDKDAMSQFVKESLETQMIHLLKANEVEEEDITNAMEEHRTAMETMFDKGQLRKPRKQRLKPKPDTWDSDRDGEWNDQPGALIRNDVDDNEDDDVIASGPAKKQAARGRGKATATTRKTAVPAKKATAAKGARSRKKVVEEDEDEEEEDVIMLDDDDDDEEDDSQSLFVKPAKSTAKKPAAKPATRARSPPKKATPKQSTLNFSQTSTQRSAPTRAARATKPKKVIEVSDDEISDDDDDAFEPVSTSRTSRGRR